MREKVKASVPEPPPVKGGEVVPDQLIMWLNSRKDLDMDWWTWGDVLDANILLIKERDAFGREKYGQPLMTGDGREDVPDITQELGDLQQYIFKLILRLRSGHFSLDEILAMDDQVVRICDLVTITDELCNELSVTLEKVTRGERR